jgi:hypothetical protein
VKLGVLSDWRWLALASIVLSALVGVVIALLS